MPKAGILRIPSFVYQGWAIGADPCGDQQAKETRRSPTDEQQVRSQVQGRKGWS
ncbi:hypothetical protein [Phormidium sp. CCY1219]|uniref:hypothetical protein n=1 Tax=Phormidium sp. CCY1219 TaxID=2886104 RepID=UPI002D1E6088|nr:hypothetical protein [Phormidium sp. CCY1219]MEB3830548.1 hypothetical protein [Phormidium sp. CCY1219]